MRLRLQAPAGFSLRRTVCSHGWSDLAPFRAATTAEVLSTVIPLEGGGARGIVLSQDGGRVIVESPGPADAATRRTIEAAARRILALDVDLGAFHDAVRGDPRFRWIAETGSGRLLRAPNGFEDVVKLVLTTNCSWAFTKKMVVSLVERYGERAPDGSRSFPTPRRLAKVAEAELRGIVRAGYRSPYLAALSRSVAAREVDPDSWDSDPRSAAELRKEMLRLPGVGPYVAENLLKFIGKPAGLALDSAIRAKYSAMYHGGRKIKDGTIARRCAPLGDWAGLALWFDMTRDWYDGDGPSGKWVSFLSP